MKTNIRLFLLVFIFALIVFPYAKAQRENIQNLITSLEKKQEKIKALIEKGKSLEEVKKEFGIEQSQSRWPSLVEIIFKEITEEKYCE